MGLLVLLWKESSCCLGTPHFVNARAKASTKFRSFSAKEQTILALWLKFSTRSSVKIIRALKKIGYSKNHWCGGQA